MERHATTIRRQGCRAREVYRPGWWDSDSVGAHRTAVKSRRPGAAVAALYNTSMKYMLRRR